MNDPLTPLTPAQTANAEKNALKEGYVKRVEVGADVELNIILDGLPNETMSARGARADANGSKFGRVFSWVLTKIFGKNHGAKACAGDAARAARVAAAEANSGLIDKP